MADNVNNKNPNNFIFTIGSICAVLFATYIEEIIFGNLPFNLLWNMIVGGIALYFAVYFIAKPHLRSQALKTMSKVCLWWMGLLVIFIIYDLIQGKEIRFVDNYIFVIPAVALFMQKVFSNQIEDTNNNLQPKEVQDTNIAPWQDKVEPVTIAPWQDKVKDLSEPLPPIQELDNADVEEEETKTLEEDGKEDIPDSAYGVSAIIAIFLFLLLFSYALSKI